MDNHSAMTTRKRTYLTRGTTEAERAAIREEVRTMSVVKVAVKHGISRSRVHQILRLPPDDVVRAEEEVLGLGRSAEATRSTTVPFAHSQLRHLQDDQAQKQIAAETASIPEIAAKYGISRYAVERILWSHGIYRKRGRKPRP